MHIIGGVDIYLCQFIGPCVSYVCLLVCVCVIKSESCQKPCHPSQTFSEFDVLLHKIYSKVLPKLRYPGSTNLGPCYHHNTLDLA